MTEMTHSLYWLCANLEIALGNIAGGLERVDKLGKPLYPTRHEPAVDAILGDSHFVADSVRIFSVLVYPGIAEDFSYGTPYALVQNGSSTYSRPRVPDNWLGGRNTFRFVPGLLEAGDVRSLHVTGCSQEFAAHVSEGFLLALKVELVIRKMVTGLDLEGKTHF